MLVHASYWNSCEFSVTSNSTYLLGLLSVFLTLSVIEVAEEGVRERVELPLPRREPLPLGSGAGLVSGPGVSGGRLSLSPPPVGDTVTATDSPRPSFGTTGAGGTSSSSSSSSSPLALGLSVSSSSPLRSS